MSSTTDTQREQVFCHQCEEEWFRDEHGLTCPQCHSDFVEIIERNGDDPREDHLHIGSLGDLAIDPPIWDPEDSPGPASNSDDSHDHNRMQWTATGPNSYTFRNSFQIPHPGNNPNNGPGQPPQLGPIGGLLGSILGLMGNTAQASANNGGTRSYRFDSPSGNAHFSITTTTTGFGPRDPNNPGPPDMPVQNLQHLLEMFQMPLSPGAPGQQRGLGGPPGFDNRTLFDILLGGQYAHSQEDFDRIISDLMERTQATSGAPAATEDAIESLPKKTVDKAMLGDSGKAECTICMAEVDFGDVVTELYCKHWFHTDCIKVWLEQHNTCPHCRKSIEEGKAEVDRKGGGLEKNKEAGEAESSNRSSAPSNTRRAPSTPSLWNRRAPSPPEWPSAHPPIPPPHTRPDSTSNGLSAESTEFHGRPLRFPHNMYTPPINSRSESDSHISGSQHNPYSRRRQSSYDSSPRRSRSGEPTNTVSSAHGDRRRGTRDYPRDRSYERRDYERRRRSGDERRRRGSNEEQESPGLLQRARDWITGHGPGHGQS